jgi:hypothetical protein
MDDPPFLFASVLVAVHHPKPAPSYSGGKLDALTMALVFTLQQLRKDPSFRILAPILVSIGSFYRPRSVR